MCMISLSLPQFKAAAELYMECKCATCTTVHMKLYIILLCTSADCVNTGLWMLPRRNLGGTQVSGDVSGWAALTQATRMCVHARGAATLRVVWVCVRVGRGAVPGGVAAPANDRWLPRTARLACVWAGVAGLPLREGAMADCPAAPWMLPRRLLEYTQVSGDVSGWAALTQATYMCVHARGGATLRAVWVYTRWSGRGARRRSGTGQRSVAAAHSTLGVCVGGGGGVAIA